MQPRRLPSLFVALATIAAYFVVAAVTALPASAQRVDHTFSQVDCTAVVNGSTIHQKQDITVSITAPDSVTPGQSFAIGFPGGTALLPTQSNGLNITQYSNIFLVYQVNNTTFTAGTIVNPGTAQLIPAGSTTPQNIVQAVTLPAANQLKTGQPGPFSPGPSGPNNNATLITPDIGVSSVAPSSGSVTMNAVSLTTNVKLNGAINTAVTCNIPQDILITIPVGAANVPPTVNAGPDVSGTVGTAIALSGSVTDPDSTPTDTWTINDAGCSFVDASAPSTSVTCTNSGTFTATLTADDGVNAPVADTAQVTVSPAANVPPTVNAGPDVSGTVGTAIALSGSVTDPDSTPTDTWTINDAGCSFADTSAPSTSVTCTNSGTFTATLTADDGVNAPVADTAQVTVSPAANVPPTVNAGPDVSGTVGTAIALSGSVTDPDSTPTDTWTINDAGCSFADASAPSTSVTCTSAGTFTATLTADDGVNAPVADTAQVTVSPAANVPPTVNAGPDVSGTVGTAIALSGSVTDPDSTPTDTWTINDAGCSFADASAPSTSVTCTSAGTFTATLTADDGVNAPVADTAQVTVSPAANVPPTVNAGPDVSGTVGTAIALSGSVTDPDSTPTDTWTINDAGCSFTDASAPSTSVTCTNAGTFTATLTANDGVNAPVSDTAEVTVNPVSACSSVCVSIGDVTTYEDGVASLPVTLNRTATADVTITATIGGGSAVNGYRLPRGSVYDYKSNPIHTLHIKAGRWKTYVNVRALTDGVTETDETFNVTLSNPVNAGLDRAVGTATIKDSTPLGAGHLLIGSSTIVRGGTGTKVVARVSVVLSAPSATDVTVMYSTSSTGLVAKTDYGAKLNKTLTFKAGQTHKLITVTILGSDTQSGTQSIDFDFSNPVGATLDFGAVGTVMVLPAPS